MCSEPPGGVAKRPRQGLEWSPRTCIPNNFPGDAVLLVWGPLFESKCPVVFILHNAFFSHAFTMPLAMYHLWEDGGKSVTQITFCKTLPAHGPQAGRKNQWGGKMGGVFTTIMQHKDISLCNDQPSTDGIFLNFLSAWHFDSLGFLCLRRSGSQT